MVPALWAVVGELPVTGNGKVDRAALQRMARSAATGHDTLTV
jgi:acyl-CoA synthetase (AMP-forming)/AMP-acid ligase II